MKTLIFASKKHQTRSKGFTAVEIAMVATVIAIIALLALPIFRDRADAAREAAVFDEMSSIAKMMLLAEADVSFKPRLQDLDNSSSESISGGLLSVSQWNGQTPSITNVDSNWGGPYLAYGSRNTSTINELRDYWYRTSDSAGFIVVISFDPDASRIPDTTRENEDNLDDLYPLDPWGSPYIFFGDGRLGTESNFDTNIVISLGPDGVAGATSGTINDNPGAYRRFGNTTGVLGDPGLETTDVDTPGDFVYRF